METSALGAEALDIMHAHVHNEWYGCGLLGTLCAQVCRDVMKSSKLANHIVSATLQ